MIDIPKDYSKLQWAKNIARYYILRGKEFSIEIDPIKQMLATEQFLKLGCKKFYFTWRGMYKNQFYSAMETISYSINIIERFPNVQIYIIYIPPYEIVNPPPEDEWLKTSITFLTYSLSNYKNINCIIRKPHPWFGLRRKRVLSEIEQIGINSGVSYIEDKCGCLTITPNTNIYCCPFCERRKRKKLFGNAAYDKFVCGTIDRGIFREVQCDKCDCRGR